MRTVFPTQIKAEVILSPKEAEMLLKRLKNDDEFYGLGEQLKRGMEPAYEYTIKCAGCGRDRKALFRHKQTKVELRRAEEYTLCESCADSEDFK